MADEAQLNALIDGSSKTAALCEAQLNFLRAWNNEGGSVGSRVRADHLGKITAA